MRQLLLFSLLFSVATLTAQSVSINTDGSAAHASSILEVKSTTKGILVPRMTTTQRNLIAAPATGLLIYNTSTHGFQYRNATAWVNLNTDNFMSDADNDTKIQVEELPDEDRIRFDIGGTERLIMQHNSQGTFYMDIRASNMNTLIGQNTGKFTTALGTDNTAVGSECLPLNTDGSRNSVFGARSMYLNTTGVSNSAFGYAALQSNTTGSYNLALGGASLLDNTTGSYNVGVGINTLFRSQTSNYNVAVGTIAGRDYIHGDGNTFLGAGTQANADGYSQSTAVGYNAVMTASNQVRIGNASTASIGGFQNWTNASDARLKKDVKADVPGLAFINLLQPVTYVLDHEKISRELGQEAPKEASQMRNTGFLAQDVESAAKACGFDFSGVDAPKNDRDFYGLRYAEFTVPLVKAVQELDAENRRLKSELSDLTKRLEALEAAQR
jgi:hypothetical protein